jgi:transcriptional regulator with XRE-family HTH domain
MLRTMTDTARLITARKLRRLTQRRLAERADISASYLAELEKTNDAPSPEVQARIARVLQFEPAELWPGSTSAEAR